MDDLISRQDAIDAVSEACLEWRGIFGRCEDALKDLPSAQKKGEWIKLTGMMQPDLYGLYVCSRCNGFAMRDFEHRRQKLTQFCPNCGADMRGEN